MAGESSKQIIENTTQVPSLPLEFFEGITKNFSERRQIGQGGSGIVYKGKLPDGEVRAVKRFYKVSGVSDRKFVNENRLLEHENIVQILGSCCENSERLLCFEYMRNGNLRQHLSDRILNEELTWDKRYKIIKGICLGLDYLHDHDPPIIHMDLKPENILLDDNMNPKIADFGQSRVLARDKTQTKAKKIGGTRGYMPPEFMKDGIISKEFDIFSFGVVIIEIVTGHKDYADMEFSEFVEHETMNCINRMKGHTSELEINHQEIRNCIEIGLCCVDPKRTERPRIFKIAMMLDDPELVAYHYNGSRATRKIDLYRELLVVKEKSRRAIEGRKNLLLMAKEHIEDKEKMTTIMKNLEKVQMGLPTSSDDKSSGVRMIAQNMTRDLVEKKMRKEHQTIRGLVPIQKNFRVPIQLIHDEYELMKNIKQQQYGRKD